MAGLKTDTQIQKAIRTADRDKTLYFAIEGYTGLRLRVRGDYVEFQHRYSHPYTKARIQLTLGDYNKGYTLEHARQAHRENLALLAQKIDPIEHKQAQHLAEVNLRKNTLQYFINEWKGIQAKKPLADDTYRKQADNLAPIEKQLGHMRVTDIKPSTVISFINGIQKTTPYKGLAIKSILKAILQIALTHRVIEHNPASDLVGTLTPHKTTHHPAITTPAEFAKLLKDIDGLPDDTDNFNKPVLQLLALTFARIGDICSMRWADINLDTGLWEFRPQKAGRRGDMTDLVTPLAPQSLAILERMQAITGGQDYVFYNPKRKAEPYTDTQRVNKLLNSPAMNDGKGYLNIHSPHGFRATAKTMLMERLGYDELITELQLGHRMLNRYGKAYSRMEMIKQRRAMMTDWGNYLDDLKAGKIDNVMYMSKPAQPAQLEKAVNN